jgi:hypothetical protein
MLTLSMTDTYGDGWNGAYWTWQQTDGATPADVGTLEGGSVGTAQLNIYDSGECYTMTVGTGTYDYEIEWTITDKNGYQMLTGGAPTELELCTHNATAFPTATPTTPAPTMEVDQMLTLKMWDSYGDGWNNAMFTWATQGESGHIMIDTLSYGSSGSHQLPVYDPDACYTMDVSSGAWAYECSWEIQTALGDVLLEGGAPDYGQVICMSYNDTFVPSPAPTDAFVPSPAPTSDFACTTEMYNKCCAADDDDPCKDSTTWYTQGKQWKNCYWVADWKGSRCSKVLHRQPTVNPPSTHRRPTVNPAIPAMSPLIFRPIPLKAPL